MKIGFIGCGNMAQAMISGILTNKYAQEQDVMASNRSTEILDRMHEKTGIRVTPDNREVTAFSELLVLSVKPQIYPKVIEEIRESMDPNTLVISIAPGISLEQLEKEFGRPLLFVRCMPNTPAMVLEGMTAFVPSRRLDARQVEIVQSFLSSFGQCVEVSESQMDAVVAVSGSSPAYVFMFIEAMADAAVKQGLPRNLAYTMAAQSVLGSAKMVLETGQHPAVLKDMVCSPAGTTIEAVQVLEKQGFRSAVIEAMEACADKSRGLK